MKKIILILLTIVVMLLVYTKTSVDASVIIPDGAIRVRVIANSNSLYDQSMKMKVKSYIEKTISADGAIFAIVCNSESERKSVRDFLCSDVKKKKLERILFALPKKVLSIEETARKFFALKELCNQASDDEVLLSEYQVVLEDVCQVLFSFVRN